MKKNKKGFTLIELLAVIVILAIIALIAVPVIINIINKASKSAFKDTAYGIISAGELYYAEQLLEANGMTEDKTFEFPNKIQGLGVKGDLPDSGSMTVTKDGKIALAISNGKYCVTKGLDDTDVIVTEDGENCTLPAGDNTGGTTSNTLSVLATTSTELGVDNVAACLNDGTECEAGTAFAIQVNETTTEKFYVLSDDGNTVTLILNRNLYAEGNTTEPDLAWISKEDYVTAGGIEADYGTYGNNNKGPITAINALKERTSGWTNIPEREYTYSGIANDGTTRKYEDITLTMKVRMLTYDEASSDTIGCTSSSGSCPDWLLENLYETGDSNTYGYWLSTVSSSCSYSTYDVDCYGYVDDHAVNNDTGRGLRPVIELSK